MTDRKHKTVRLIDDVPYEYMIDNAIDRAIAAIEGEAGLVTQLVSVQPSFRVDGVCFVTVLADVETAEASKYTTSPFTFGDEMMLKDLRPGAIFVTRDGQYAVKTDYREENVMRQYYCVFLANGQHARFPYGNSTLVREVLRYSNAAKATKA